MQLLPTPNYMDNGSSSPVFVKVKIKAKDVVHPMGQPNQENGMSKEEKNIKENLVELIPKGMFFSSLQIKLCIVELFYFCRSM